MTALSLTFGILSITTLYLLAASRLFAMISVVGLQGILLGCIPLFMHEPSSWHTWILCLCGIGFKGAGIPFMLRRAMRDVAIPREVRPVVSLTLSTAVGVLIMAGSYLLHSRIVSIEPFSSPMIPAAIAMALSGLFLITARTLALTQVLGFLVFENGIYLFGIAVSAASPLLIELGILLDVFVGVFVMGIVIHHINSAFDSMHVDELQLLKE